MSTWELQLSPQEVKYFSELFQQVSKQQKGRVTGAEAVGFFATSGVSTEILSEIWEAADRDKVGYLTLETFSIALKLIACAQNKKEANANVLSTVVPLPQFDAITHTEREKYANIFKVHQSVNGTLDADTARNVFIKSKLPNETLSHIWCLADVRQSGSLNQTEFIIAMHYIAKLMDRTLTTLPDKLPPAVYQSASSDATITSTTQSPMMRHMAISSSPSFHNSAARHRSIMTPPQRAKTIDSLGNLAFGPSAAIHEPVQQWDVSAQEKQQFDVYFDKIDSSKAGVIQGKEAVEFFKNSRLPEADLAHIWDLADIQQRGALSRDEFAVAMHLIHKRLAGEQLPQTIPKTLVPPSNTNHRSILQSPFGNSPAFVPASPDFFASPASVSAPPPPPPPPPQQQLQLQQQRSLIDEDLLADFGNDQIPHEIHQAGMIRNQISSMSTQTADLSNKKQSTESILDQLIQQKKDLEAQLINVRMSHETAVKDLNEIQETVRREEGEWDQVRAEYDTAQQQLGTIQNEIAQAQQTLENGRAETESLRRRINEIQQETNAATAELDKMRAQTKHQKMMLDINRRQVTAAEQDCAQVERDLQDYKVASHLNPEKDCKTDQEESISTDVTTTAASPEDTPSVVSTPALDILFGESPVRKSAASPCVPAVSPFDAFSPNTTTEPNNVDFDAIFGNISSPSATTITTTAFDPTAWATATAPTKSSRGPPPPPPPPQNRHHRQPSESVGSVNSAASPSIISKKQRAPPPPPPSTFSVPQQTNTQIEENSDEDDFEAAFAGKLPEAKVVCKDDEDDEFADFDDAFSAFDAKLAQPKASALPAVNDNWASNFGEFSFSGEDKVCQKPAQNSTTPAPAPATTDDQDWDSIFGSAAAPFGSSATQASLPAVAAATTTTGISNMVNNSGFDDAFSSFGDDFGKQSPVAGGSPATANSKGKQSEHATFSPSATAKPVHSIGIVGDKIEDLVKMGFEEQEAKDALNRYDQDLEKASNFLLDQSSRS